MTIFDREEIFAIRMNEIFVRQYLHSNEVCYEEEEELLLSSISNRLIIWLVFFFIDFLSYLYYSTRREKYIEEQRVYIRTIYTITAKL